MELGSPRPPSRRRGAGSKANHRAKGHRISVEGPGAANRRGLVDHVVYGITLLDRQTRNSERFIYTTSVM
jgi:hypothetical protein